jgi:hypothetical protein
VSRYELSVICQSALLTLKARHRDLRICSGVLVRPARLERATSWFVAVNSFVDPAQLTSPEGSLQGRHLDPILDPRVLPPPPIAIYPSSLRQQALPSGGP